MSTRPSSEAPSLPTGWSIQRQGNEISISSPVATGPGCCTVSRDDRSLASRLLFALADAWLDAPTPSPTRDELVEEVRRLQRSGDFLLRAKHEAQRSERELWDAVQRREGLLTPVAPSREVTGQQDDLPLAPKPWRTVDDELGEPVAVFRLFQLRDYARVALASDEERRQEQPGDAEADSAPSATRQAPHR